METTNKSRWEKFNLWMYNFLSSVLPYSTPLPVAVLTARRARGFLDLDPYSAGILVFGLEGIGLLCTSLLVDAVVEWIKSRNLKSVTPVILFGIMVAVYVRILILLNVTLEQAGGNTSPALSAVITLLCYIPLISGVINGWNKLRIENKHKEEDNKLHIESREDQKRREEEEKEERRLREQHEHELRLTELKEKEKTERTKAKANAPVIQPAPRQVYQQMSETVSSLTASHYLVEILEWLNIIYEGTGMVPRVKEIADHFQLDYERNKGYISTKRKEWAIAKGIELSKKK